MALNNEIKLTDFGSIDYSNKMSCKITNEKNIVNLRSYFCFVVGKQVIPKQRTFVTTKINKSFKRVITSIDDQDDILKVDFLFNAKEHSFIWTNVRQFITQIEKCKIKFSTEAYYFDCIIDDWTIEFQNHQIAIVTVTFKAQAFTETEKINIASSGKYLIIGAKETPINFMVKAKQALTNFKINDVTIKSLAANETIYIDSFNRKVIKNGQNAIDDVLIFEFPEAIGQYEIQLSSNSQAEIVMDYLARW